MEEADIRREAELLRLPRPLAETLAPRAEERQAEEAQARLVVGPEARVKSALAPSALNLQSRRRAAQDRVPLLRHHREVVEKV